MTKGSVCTLAALAIAITFATAITQADQIRRSGPEKVLVDVSLKVGGEAYDAKGQGSCTHAPKASIYGLLAEMWTVRQEGEGRSVQLTLWKPPDGSASMFSLSLNGVNDRRSPSISTVKGGQVMGSGTVTLAPAAKGGTFTVEAKTRMGDAVTGTITCEAFTPAIAEGGD